MGVDISSLIEGADIEMEDLAGKRLAVDAFNVLYQFLSTIRQRDGTPLMDPQGRVTSHLTGVFYRTGTLITSGIRPCFVFDGKPPDFKAVTEKRRKRRREARRRYEKAKKEGRKKAARKYAKQSSKLTDAMVDETKELLDAMGVPWVQAPSEGEAQAAMMCAKGDVYATASQDYDALVFGSTRLVRNLNVTGKRKLPGRNKYVKIMPQLYSLEQVLGSLGLDRVQLVRMAVLIGTDYNPGGIKGVGPKTALKLVRNHEDPFEEVEWNFDIEPEDIVEWYIEPETTGEYDLGWQKVDDERVRDILCTRHGFSEKRVNNKLDRIGTGVSQRTIADF